MEAKVDYGVPLQSCKVNKNVLRDTGYSRFPTSLPTLIPGFYPYCAEHLHFLKPLVYIVSKIRRGKIKKIS